MDVKEIIPSPTETPIGSRFLLHSSRKNRFTAIVIEEFSPSGEFVRASSERGKIGWYPTAVKLRYVERLRSR